ncbi:hypothetical protein Ccrd_000769 [Cynara cardunculus var. scolymus]|uniref:Uncharacterized protein n=1 Tax=Cynara cardunculus var. scolymus TaxID=59895 RepID=A0A124SDJ6_CYNCS|nr:hypothetical protein Ccrd_000769 [Cynara cardunculus var. scolymus]
MAMETPPVGLRWACENLLCGPSAASSDVLESSLVNDHPAVSMSNTEEELLTDDINKKVKPCCTEHFLSRADQDYMEKIRELHDRLDMVMTVFFEEERSFQLKKKKSGFITDDEPPKYLRKEGNGN